MSRWPQNVIKFSQMCFFFVKYFQISRYKVLKVFIAQILKQDLCKFEMAFRSPLHERMFTEKDRVGI
jgi:hypothetical protein